MKTILLVILVSVGLSPLPKSALAQEPPEVERPGIATPAELAAFKRGEIPRRFRENFRIVPDEDPATASFHKQMTALSKRLRPEWDPIKEPVRFVISDENDANAFAIREAKPPIIGFTKGLLREAKNLDQLAYVLGHEWTHHEIYKKLGAGRNSKTEEYTADILPLTWMQDAGLDPKQGLEIAQRIFKPDQINVWMRILGDVHGLSPFRISMIEKGLAMIDRQRGGLRNQPSPLPVQIQLAGEKATHESHLQKLMRSSNWSQADNPTKLKTLENALRDVPPGYEGRVEDIRKAIRTVNIDRNNKAEMKAVDAVADAIIDNKYAHYRDRLYASLSRNVAPTSQIQPPLGRAKTIAKLVQDFVSATSSEAANTAAEDLIKTLGTAKIPPDLLQQLDLANFELPELEEIERARKHFNATKKNRFPKVPWNEFVGYSEKHPSIGQALLLLGVKDARLLESLPLEKRAAILGNSELHPISTPRLPDGSIHPVDRITIHDKGFVTNAEPKHYDVDMSGRTRTRNPSRWDHFVNRTWLEQREILFEQAMKGDRVALQKLIQTNRLIEPNSEGSWLPANRLIENPEVWAAANAQLVQNDPKAIQSEEIQTVHFNRQQDLANEIENLLQSGDPKQIEIAEDFISKHLFKIWIGHQSIVGPIAKLILSQDNGLSLKTKLGFLLSSTYLDPRRVNLALLRSVGGYQEPKTSDELIKAMEKLSKDAPNLNLRSAAGLAEIADPQHLEAISLVRRFPKKVELEKVLPLIDTPKLDTETEESIRQIVIAYPWNRIGTSLPRLAKAVRVWKVVEGEHFFPIDGVLKNKTLTSLVDRIAALPMSTQKSDLLSLLLFGQDKQGTKRIQDPTERNRIFQLWTQDLLERYGKDDGSAAYHRKVLKEAEAAKVLTVADRTELLQSLAAQVQSQRKLSDSLKDTILPKNRGALEKSHWTGLKVELILAAARRDPERRRSLIDFISSPMDELKLTQFADEFDLGEIHESLSGVRLKAQARDMHNNYWAAPLVARAVMLDELIAPSEDVQANPEETRKEALELVMRKLFPLDQEFAPEARKILQAYIEVIPDYQRNLLLSALMASSQTSDKTSSAGERLARLLELMGPAETKLGQVIHSYPRTPENLRAGVGRLKEHADEPARWDLFKQFDEVLANDPIRKQVDKVEEVLGSASYYVVVKARMKDGSEKVFALLRPHALDRAENGFDLLGKLAAKLGEGDPIARELIPMVEQAKAMAKPETDHQINDAQNRIAIGLYRGKKAQVDGRTFDFEPVENLRSGPGWRMMDYAPGIHFNELPKNTADEKAYRRSLAKAYLALELDLILQGKEFDHDRHGAQMRIDPKTGKIYLFDFGAMRLQEPSAEERRLVGETIREAFAAQNLDPDGLSRFMFEKIRKLNETGAAPTYLIEVQKGLLALGDFFKEMDFQQKDMESVLASVVAKGDIHPEIKQEIEKAIAIDTLKMVLTQICGEAMVTISN